jgi:hypothetical protein
LGILVVCCDLAKTAASNRTKELPSLCELMNRQASISVSSALLIPTNTAFLMIKIESHCIVAS